jgi:hypothetical protein
MGFKRRGHIMGDFLMKIVLSPIGFIIVGVLVSAIIGSAVYNMGNGPAWIVIGIIISVIGVVRLVIRIVTGGGSDDND